jgi:hypothetical protein
MADPPGEERFDIGPNVQFGRLSDEALTMLFQTHIAIAINSANLVWQRFSIMLAANAIVFGFLANRREPKTIEILFGTIFGLFLCLFWFLLVRSEWKFFERWMALSRRFYWPTLGKNANPHHHIHNEDVPLGKWAKCLTFGVVLLFACGYAFLLIYHLYEKRCLIASS